MIRFVIQQRDPKAATLNHASNSECSRWLGFPASATTLLVVIIKY
jgi:hypothetical protein